MFSSASAPEGPQMSHISSSEGSEPLPLWRTLAKMDCQLQLFSSMSMALSCLRVSPVPAQWPQRHSPEVLSGLRVSPAPDQTLHSHLAAPLCEHGRPQGAFSMARICSKELTFTNEILKCCPHIRICTSCLMPRWGVKEAFEDLTHAAPVQEASLCKIKKETEVLPLWFNALQNAMLLCARASHYPCD